MTSSRSSSKVCAEDTLHVQSAVGSAGFSQPQIGICRADTVPAAPAKDDVQAWQVGLAARSIVLLSVRTFGKGSMPPILQDDWDDDVLDDDFTNQLRAELEKTSTEMKQ